MSEDQYIDESKLPASNNEQPLSESEIVNPLPETNNMEVHHHPHVEKKSFKEYLLEGLMIFLAVSMGFIAENIREHFGDKTREKEYMQSLMKDLKLDTIYLHNTIAVKEKRIASQDSVIDYLISQPFATKIPATLLEPMHQSLWDQFFWHFSGSIDQLKNSGSLRLIRNKGVVDSIGMYYQQVLRAESGFPTYYENQHKGFDLFEKFVDATDAIQYAKNKITNSGFIKINRAYLNNYLGNLNTLKWYTKSSLKRDKQVRQLAINLLVNVQKEYHLEDK